MAMRFGGRFRTCGSIAEPDLRFQRLPDFEPRARAFDDVNEIRDMRRTTVAGDAPTVDQKAA